jgi:hypothetical protein
VSRKKPPLAFLCNLLNYTCLSDHLSNFFHRHAFSFMQNRPGATTRSVPP